MHIIAAIVVIVSAILVWQWRVQRAAELARELDGAVRTAANLPRRFAFKRRTGKKGLALVDEPMEAAAVLMVELARADGLLSRDSREVIETLTREEFQLEAEDADALIAHAQWLVREGPISDAIFRRMSRFLLDHRAMTAKEIVDLDGMLVAVSEADGLPSAEQLSLLQVFRDTVGLKT